MSGKNGAHPAPTFMDPGHTMWVLIDELYWMTTKLWERRMYELGISASQARVLLVIRDGPIKPSAVATMLFQETQSITGILHRVEGRKLVERQPDEFDRRAVQLVLSDEGRKMTDKIVAIMSDLNKDIFGGLRGDGLSDVAGALREIRDGAFKLPECDFKLRRAQRFPIWS